MTQNKRTVTPVVVNSRDCRVGRVGRVGRRGSEHLLRCALMLMLLSAPGWAGCSDDDATNQNQNNNTNQEGCPEGHSMLGPACVPDFDLCSAANEKAVLGGGCEAVGVTQCATGFAADSTGSCDPILPAAPCVNGTMPVLGETECQPVGVQACPVGFQADGAGGCEPVLPSGPCGDHELEVLGETTCQPLGDCGASTWGNIGVDATTVYVDAGSTAPTPDGSQGAPFTTITAALAVVAAGGQIAIAQGVYTESVVLTGQTRITGRCAELVTIEGTPAVVVETSGSQSEISGVTVSGGGYGLQVRGASAVSLSQSRVAATADHGIEVESGGELSLSRVKVDQTTHVAINFAGAALSLSETVVQDTQSASDDTFGRGLYAICDAGGSCGEVTVDRSIFQRNKDVTIYAKGANLSVTDSLVRDSLWQVSDGGGGWAIAARCDPVANVCGTLHVEGTAMLDNADQTFTAIGVVTTMRDTTIRRTVPNSAGNFGSGVVNFCDPQVNDCGSLLIEDSVIESSYEFGILAFGPQVVLSGVMIQNTIGRSADGLLGVGLSTECYSVSACESVTVTDSLIENNATSGVLSNGPLVTIRRTVVRDTQSQPSDGAAGTGIAVQCDPNTHLCGNLVVEQSIVERNRMTGISVAGPDTIIRGCLVRDTMPEVDTDTGGDGMSFGCDPLEGRCGNVLVEGCVVENNRESGILGGSAQLDIHSTVVRGTTPGNDPSLTAYSWGVALGCDPRGNCGTVTITDSTLEQNANAGVVAVGPPLTVERSIVRETALDTGGNISAVGISAGCTLDGICGATTIRDVIIDSHKGVGLQFSGVDAIVESSTVRNIVASPNTAKLYSWGALSICSYDMPTLCGSLTMTQTLFEKNQSAALGTGGVEAQITSTVVRDTDSTSDSGGYGFGFEGICYEGVCASVSLQDSLFEGNAGAAVLLAGVPATLHRVAVTATSSIPGQDSASAGYGVVAFCLDGSCSTLEITECLLQSNATAALSVDGTSGAITDSIISAVAANSFSGAHGYGVQISGGASPTPVAFDVRSCKIMDASLAGLLFHQASGVISDTEIFGADFPVVLSQGAQAEIDDSNDLSGNLQDEPTWTTMEPAPSPAPDEPVDISAPPELP